jgi:hypothetical protein
MSFKPQVRKAQRQACKASIMIEGLPGEGKSGAALLIAYYLVGENWEKVGHVDTENKSADLFVNIPCSNGQTFGEFLVCPLDKIVGFSPSNFLAAKEALIEAGAEAVIKDSISHAWQYDGGVLDLVNKAKSKNPHYAKDKYAAWGDEDVVREKLNLIALIRDPRAHIITTVRVKEKMEYDKDEEGKTIIKSLGEQQIQQADLKYEPDLVLHMITPGYRDDTKIVHPKARVTKSRYAIFKKDVEYELTPDLLRQLRAYLEDGADPAEILEQQRQDYISAVNDYLTTNKSAIAIWKVMKEDAGFKDVKLADMPLDVIKQLFVNLTA